MATYQIVWYCISHRNMQLKTGYKKKYYCFVVHASITNDQLEGLNCIFLNKSQRTHTTNTICQKTNHLLLHQHVSFLRECCFSNIWGLFKKTNPNWYYFSDMNAHSRMQCLDSAFWHVSTCSHLVPRKFSTDQLAPVRKSPTTLSKVREWVHKAKYSLCFKSIVGLYYASNSYLSGNYKY